MFLRTDDFDAWLSALRDSRGRARIAIRIRSVEAGNLGDCEPVGKGVFEMRIHIGPGYRVHFSREDEATYVLLLGGTKATQRRDTKRAITLAGTLKKET